MTKIDIAIIVILLIILGAGSWSTGYKIGRNSPCTQVEDIEIGPVQ